jgi:Short C-terminal domain
MKAWSKEVERAFMSDLAADLQQLAALHERGVLTDEEFQAAKRARIASEAAQAGPSVPPPSTKSAGLVSTSDSLCPICHRDDQVSRTSHIAASGMSSIALGGSLHGGGIARSLSHRTWRPDDLGSWYSSSSSFAFSASISLSGSSATTLASQLAPLSPPHPIPRGDDERYVTYWGEVQELADKSYYCSRDGVAFISGTEYPPIEPSNYQEFLNYEPARKVYGESAGLAMTRVPVTTKGYSIAIPSNWKRIEHPAHVFAMGNLKAFAPSMSIGFQPYVSISNFGGWGFGVSSISGLLQNPNKNLLRPEGNNHEASGGLTPFNVGGRDGKQTTFMVTTPDGNLVGWCAAFRAFGNMWVVAFVTHPSCMALDAVIISKIVESLPQGR